MSAPLVIFLLIGVAVALLGGSLLLVFWGQHWGATDEERAAAMTGDDYFSPESSIRVRMTRAISIAAPSAAVWPWLAQMGRGAGFYSYDFLDNGRKASARHLVGWIPSPQLGDASAIGYLRHLKEGKRIVWWAPRERFLGVTCSMCISMQVTPEGNGSRLAIRVSADAEGRGARFMIWVFRFIDSIMATRQLASIKQRAERFGGRQTDPEPPGRSIVPVAVIRRIFGIPKCLEGDHRLDLHQIGRLAAVPVEAIYVVEPEIKTHLRGGWIHHFQGKVAGLRCRGLGLQKRRQQ